MLNKTEPPPANYDEANVPTYILPDPLRRSDGATVTDATAWRTRRAEILELFHKHVYGQTPTDLPSVHYDVFEEDATALNGLALRRQVTLRFGDAATATSIDLLLYLPNKRNGPVPTFVGLNFYVQCILPRVGASGAL